jgi:hypothetical protein
MSDRRVTHGPTVRAWAWSWGPDEERRPGLPWIGIFLVVFGVLLLLENALPTYRRLGDVAVLAAGLASLVVWLMRRSTIALYAGAFLTAAALPGTIEALGLELGPGWGMVWVGLALLFVAAVRLAQHGGLGWQARYGAILAGLALFEIVAPAVGDIGLPLIIVAIGVVLLLRGRQSI